MNRVSCPSFFCHSHHVAHSLPPQPLVICGPSGTGKSTLLNRLFAAYPDKFGFSVSHTTRKPRAGEVDKVNYNFVTMEQFEKLIEDGAFVENAMFSGNRYVSAPPVKLAAIADMACDLRYGTTAAAVAAVAEKNRRCILDIDTQGVKLIKANHPQLNPVFLFLAPPSISELAKRLAGRGTETEEQVNARLAAAKSEIKYAVEGGHDIVIVNDDVDRAYGLLEKVALGEAVDADKLPVYEGL